MTNTGQHAMVMVEARRAERVRAFLRARIIYNNGSSTIDCVIKNISATGAKIEVSSLISIPAEFDLDVPQKGRVYRAKMMWRDAESAGLHFLAAPDRDASDARVEALERENRRLKATIVEMSKKLDELGHSMNSFEY